MAAEAWRAGARRRLRRGRAAVVMPLLVDPATQGGSSRRLLQTLAHGWREVVAGVGAARGGGRPPPSLPTG
jgi:hypothetical protein